MRRDVKKMLQHGSVGGGCGDGWESDEEITEGLESHPHSTLNTLLPPLSEPPNTLKMAKILNKNLTVSVFLSLSLPLSPSPSLSLCSSLRLSDVGFVRKQSEGLTGKSH
jgi:hypothetical protein